MSVAGSVFSQFKAPESLLGKRRSILDTNGYDMPLSYVYKIRINTPGSENTPILVQVPQQLKPYVSGDKLVHVRYVQIFDSQVQSLPPLAAQGIAFRFVVDNQRNNVNKEGLQTQIIGYANYDLNRQLHIGECQPFEMDSKVPLKIEIEFNSNGTTWTPYKLLSNPPGSIFPYIYMDIEIHYDYNEQY